MYNSYCKATGFGNSCLSLVVEMELACTMNSINNSSVGFKSQNNKEKSEFRNTTENRDCSDLGGTVGFDN